MINRVSENLCESKLFMTNEVSIAIKKLEHVGDPVTLNRLDGGFIEMMTFGSTKEIDLLTS